MNDSDTYFECCFRELKKKMPWPIQPTGEFCKKVMLYTASTIQTCISLFSGIYKAALLINLTIVCRLLFQSHSQLSIVVYCCCDVCFFLETSNL